MKKILSFFVFSLIITFVFGQEYKAIVGGTIIHTHLKKTEINSTILIKDNKILKIFKTDTEPLPEGTIIIDASDKYVVPGLVDGHIHFFQSGGLYTRPDGLDLQHRVPYDQEMAWIKRNINDVFERYIGCGITSVIDMGGPMWNFEVKEQAAIMPAAPRTYVAGPLIASYCPEVFETDDPPIVKVFSKEEALQMVHDQVNAGTDLIKIWYVVTPDSPADSFFPIVEAVAYKAHANGLPLFVHATELETAKLAIEAGADVLVHNVRDVEIDKEFLKMAKKNNVIVIPTMWVFESYAAVYGKKLDLLPIEHQKGNPFVIGTLFDMYELHDNELTDRHLKLQAKVGAVETSPIILENLKKMYDFGIIIASGTDAGNVGVIHGPSLFHEMMLMAKAGMDNHDILISTTFNGAKLVGKDTLFGSFQNGLLADAIILNSNPLEDILNASDLHLVIKDGNIFDPNDLLRPEAEELAQMQLNAYNEKDVESFLYPYDENVEIYYISKRPSIYW